MNISVVVVNYNTRVLLDRNLPRVILTSPGAEVIVVDDCSTDDSVNMLRSRFGKIKIVKTPFNQGFSSAANQGIAQAKGELIVLLNSDVIPHSGYLSVPVRWMREDPSLFAVGFAQECPEGSRIVIRGRGTGTIRKGFLHHSKGSPDATNTLWVSAGAGIFRKSIWQQVGGLNSLYDPFYWEDIDLSYRAQKAGFPVRFCPDSRVRHEQVHGSIRSNISPSRVRTVSYRNQFLFVWINITDFAFLFSHLIFLPYHMARSVKKRDWDFLKGFIDAVFRLPWAIAARIRVRSLWIQSDSELFTGLQNHGKSRDTISS